MSLHHLDPRQAGTGATPDVEIYTCALELPNTANCKAPRPHWHGSDIYGEFLTEAAALTAARAAAGFGHVAEQVCNATQANITRIVRTIPQFLNETDAAKDEGATCAWPRDAHQEGSK